MKKNNKIYSWKGYKEYLSYNPKGLWFKRKLYGWGWVPVTWQGVSITLGFVLLLFINGFYLEHRVQTIGNPTNIDLAIFLSVIVLSIIVLFWICYKKGEKPRWSWGS